MAVKTYEQQAAALRATDPSSPKAIEELRKVLGGQRGLLIAVAAPVVAEHRLAQLVEPLAAAFAPLVEDAVKRDPGCRGKIAIAKALHELDEWDDRVFVTGLRVTQLEGFSQVDTAAPLRGICGLAHVHFHRPNALDVVAALLADEARECRIAAAQALGDSGQPGATALLRYKLLLNDETEPEVLSTCFDALFALDRDASADFAIERLAGGDDDLAEAAAIALGSARIAAATRPLAAWCDAARPVQRQRIGYVALALLRSDDANALLLDAIRTRPKADAVAAASALATFKDDAAIAAALRATLDDVDAPTRKEIAELLAR